MYGRARLFVSGVCRLAPSSRPLGAMGVSCSACLPVVSVLRLFGLCISRVYAVSVAGDRCVLLSWRGAGLFAHGGAALCCLVARFAPMSFQYLGAGLI